jgi:hypothetical protein
MPWALVGIQVKNFTDLVLNGLTGQLKRDFYEDFSSSVASYGAFNRGDLLNSRRQLLFSK